MAENRMNKMQSAPVKKVKCLDVWHSFYCFILSCPLAAPSRSTRGLSSYSLNKLLENDGWVRGETQGKVAARLPYVFTVYLKYSVTNEQVFISMEMENF